DATQVLTAVAADPHIVLAGVYDRDGALFASYAAPGARSAPLPTRPEQDGYRFGSQRLELYEPISIDKRRFGTLYLRSDLGAMSRRFTTYSAVVAGVVLVAGLVALVLATRLQRYITQPVLALAQTTKAVAERQDYSTRARRFDDDELGQLTDD